MAAGLFIGLAVDVPELYENIFSPATMLVCTERVFENRDKTFDCRKVVRPDDGDRLTRPTPAPPGLELGRDDSRQSGRQVTPPSQPTVDRSPGELKRKDRSRDAGNRPKLDR